MLWVEPFWMILKYRYAIHLRQNIQYIIVYFPDIRNTIYPNYTIFFQKFGIKIVMLLSIFAVVLRFWFICIGDPGPGLYLLIISMIVYGMAFDFFNISGSLFVEKEADIKIRPAPRDCSMLMTMVLVHFGTLIAQER
jgi:hypothetical protein